ncbi:unnamed protein product [Lactuca saligna]|uniref:Protein GLUTAMINE DUMPER 3 n=1 Tax=Lactuca saligna TaxID=75948 RepID=A0AA36E735_LACSI|nr:unnamed protein product [Lactuca saligna]
MAIPSTFLMAPSSPVAVQRSLWHSPVPYLFGGLAAMMGLIAFALLILACSYWKLSRNIQNTADLESGDAKPDNTKTPPVTVFEEKYLVIMAGQVKPTFLATPSSSRASSFGSSTSSCGSSSITTSEENSLTPEKEKDANSDQVQVRITESHVSADEVS